MPKITIYVPDDLKAQMDTAEEHQPNWSGLAQEAFRAETERLATRKRSSGKMDAVIDRLRVSKERVANEDRKAGYKDGRQWAISHAEYAHLKRLADNRHDVIVGGGSAAVVGARILELKTGGFPTREQSEEIASFWDARSGFKEPSDDYIEEFVHGALEVYDEVADKL